MRLKNETQFVESGIPIPQIHTMLKNHIPNFDERRKKEEYHKNLIGFLKKAIESTELGISIDSNKIILKESLFKNSSELPNNFM